MSFSFEFHCAPSDVALLIAERGDAKSAPSHVQAFVLDAVAKLTAQIVHVKASGHLYDGQSLATSTANILVEPGTFTATP